MKTKKPNVLYFEGAGSATPETVAAGVGNCRIRTAFHAKGGRLVYLEILGGVDFGKKSPTKGKVRGYVDFAHWITDGGDDCNKSIIKGVERTGESFDYTPANILEVVRKCGGDFDAVRVLPDLAGFRVFKHDGISEGPKGYNYGDEFDFDEEATKKREEIKEEVYRLEYEARKKDKETGRGLFVHGVGGFWPNFSLWVPDDRPEALRWLVHLNCRNYEAEININAGSVRECVKSSAGWTDENYGDFSTLYDFAK